MGLRGSRSLKCVTVMKLAHIKTREGFGQAPIYLQLCLTACMLLSMLNLAAVLHSP